MVAVAAEAEAGRIPGLSGRAGLFADAIHFNDTGAWLMAMTHFAAIYARSPLGLPAALRRADGSAGHGALARGGTCHAGRGLACRAGYALTGVAAAE